MNGGSHRIEEAASVFGAKYTAMCAAGAIPPATSISSITSRPVQFGSPVG